MKRKAWPPTSRGQTPGTQPPPQPSKEPTLRFLDLRLVTSRTRRLSLGYNSPGKVVHQVKLRTCQGPGGSGQKRERLRLPSENLQLQGERGWYTTGQRGLLMRKSEGLGRHEPNAHSYVALCDGPEQSHGKH